MECSALHCTSCSAVHCTALHCTRCTAAHTAAGPRANGCLTGEAAEPRSPRTLGAALHCTALHCTELHCNALCSAVHTAHLGRRASISRCVVSGRVLQCLQIVFLMFENCICICIFTCRILMKSSSWPPAVSGCVRLSLLCRPWTCSGGSREVQCAVCSVYTSTHTTHKCCYRWHGPHVQVQVQVQVQVHVYDLHCRCI